MKKGLLLLSVVFTVILISNVTAGIYFSDINPTYNLGDFINIETSVDPVIPDYMLKVDLICSGSNVISFNLMPDDTGKASLRIPLSTNTLQDAGGICYFSGTYSDEVKSSRTFEISKKLDVSLTLSAFFAKPGEDVNIEGNALRTNGIEANGEVEVIIPLKGLVTSTASTESSDNSTNSSEEAITGTSDAVFYGKLSNGSFSVPIALLKNTPSGDYNLVVNVYEKSGSGKITNQGSTSASLKIFQILTGIDIALNEQNFDPGSYLSIKPSLVDQAGLPIDDDVSIVVKDTNTNRIFEKIIRSGETFGENLTTNLPSGYYEVDANSGDLNLSKTFFVNEKALISVEIINSTLRVTNIGNIVYKKDIEIQINGKPFVKGIELGIGETKEFRLTGANEMYEVTVLDDGKTSLVNGKVLLTGKAIGVMDNNEAESSGVGSSLFWIIFIIILVVLALAFFFYTYKKRSVASPKDRKWKLGGFGLKNKNVIEFKARPREGSEKKEEKKIETQRPQNHPVVKPIYEEKKPERRNIEPVVVRNH